MCFPSVVFLLFASLFFLLLPLTRRSLAARLWYLTLASFLFYGWWDPTYILLLLANGFIDFFAALGMKAQPTKRRLFLLLSIIGNVGMLVAFKYSYFLSKNLHHLVTSLGLPSVFYEPTGGAFLLLPVGISFYTFQSMSYTIDVFFGRIPATNNPLKFFAYLSLFPQLVAGPIVRARDLLPQMDRLQRASPQMAWDGLRLIVYGFFKKVVVADNLAPIVDAAFSASSPVPSGVFWWTVTSMFAVQIYCDFCGYTDIARGLGKWMGFEFPLNFDRPYASKSMREFWRRWHISLSTWFRDYVYIPLGGGKVSKLRSQGNLWIAMVCSGFWHGAAWNFVAWGAYHATALSAERITGWPEKVRKLPAGEILCTAVVVPLIWIGWVIFRSGSLSQISQILSLMLLGSGTEAVNPFQLGAFPVWILILFGLKELCHRAAAESHAIHGALLRLEPLILIGTGICCIFLRGPGKQFIYFQF